MVNGENVHDVAPDGQLADGVHLFGAFVAGFHQLGYHGLLVNFHAGFQTDIFLDDAVRRRQLLDGSLGSNEDDAGFLLVDHFQGCGPFGHDFFVPGIHLAVAQAGGIQLPHGQVRIEVRQLPAVGTDDFPVGGEDHQGLLGPGLFLKSAQKADFNRRS